MSTKQAAEEFKTAKHYAHAAKYYLKRAAQQRTAKSRARYMDARETALRNARVMLENALEARDR